MWFSENVQNLNSKLKLNIKTAVPITLLKVILMLFCVKSAWFRSCVFELLEAEGILTVVDEFSRRNAQVDGLIITLTCYSNYGNVIQRYALKHVLEQNGKFFETTFIQHKNETDADFENIRTFVRKYVGGEDFDPSKLQGYRNYIVGSDQVWNNMICKQRSWTNLAPYFCEFIHNNLELNSLANRISYAASFGASKIGSAMNETEQVRARPLIKKFSAISLREESGQNIVKNIWGLDSTIVLDPTLLLRSYDYSELIENSNSKEVKIGKLFYYIVNAHQRKPRFIRMIEKISRTVGGTKTGIIVLNKKRFEPVEEWLKGFRDSEFVVTDSYHGVLFSVLNNKNFVAIGSANRSWSTRFESFLKKFDLSDRLVSEKSLTKTIFTDLAPIDWDSVNKRLETLRAESLKWLLGNLKLKEKKK